MIGIGQQVIDYFKLWFCDLRKTILCHLFPGLMKGVQPNN